MIIHGRIPGTDRRVNVLVEGNVIRSVEPVDKTAPHDFGGSELYVAGGFFDPQVNGYGGIDFNGKNLTSEMLHQAARSIASSGTTQFLATLITASRERLVAQLRALARAFESDHLLGRMCIGVHLEGPYISPEEGPRGIHPREFIRRPDWEEVERLLEACDGRIRLITLAPEIEGSLPFIEKAVRKGMVIGIAHTAASAEALEDAFRAGARLSCHLGNAAEVAPARHRNPIEKQLSMDGLMASIIADGIHLPDYVVKNYIRAKGAERILLTTDSTAGAGASAGRYSLGDLEVEVAPEGGPARMSGGGRLAGSTLTMGQAIRNVIRFAGLDLGTAVQMAGQNAGRLFPEAGQGIRAGSPADLVLFEYEDRMVIQSTWIGGLKVG